MGMTLGSEAIIDQDIKASYLAIKPANILITTQPFDTDFVKSIRRIPGVEGADGSRSVSVRLMTGPDTWTTLNLKSIDFADQHVNILTPVEGKQIPADHELLLDINKLADTNARIGDVLQIKLASGTTREIRLVGIVHDLSIGQFFGMTFTAAEQGYVNRDTMKWLEQPDNFNQLYVSVGERGNDLAYVHQVADVINDHIERSNREVYTTIAKPNNHPNFANFNALKGVLSMLGLLSILLSGFLISNTLSALLKQHQRLIGIMKAIGGRDSQIIGMYMMFILFFSLIAFAIAWPLGAQAAYWLAGIVAVRINFILGSYRVIPSVALSQLAIALVIPQVSSAIPIIRGTRISVREAINSTYSGAQEAKKDLIDRILESIRGLSNPMLISLRNTFRQKGRLALTLITLTLGGAIFIGIYNVQASLDQYIQDISKYFRADVTLSFDRPYPIEEVKSVLSEIPGVRESEGWIIPGSELLIGGKSTGESVSLLGVPGGSDLVDPIMIQGRWLTPGDQNAVAINDVFLQNHPNLKPGDTIILKISGDKIDWIITGVFQFYGGNQLIAYTNSEYLSQKVHSFDRASTYRIMGSGSNLSLEDQIRLSSQVSARFSAEKYRVSDVSQGKHLIEEASGAFGFLVSVLLIMALLTAFVGSIGLTGTMSMNVMERTREIGVMRAIGATSQIVMRLVMVESAIIGLISWVLASLLAFPISYIMSNIISRAIFKAPAAFIITPKGFIIWLGLVLVLSGLASILPARGAARLTIREVLAYE
jgi:putative ABC transport system permease protein